MHPGIPTSPEAPEEGEEQGQRSLGENRRRKTKPVHSRGLVRREKGINKTSLSKSQRRIWAVAKGMEGVLKSSTTKWASTTRKPCILKAGPHGKGIPPTAPPEGAHLRDCRDFR
ncbi:hypothetical protein GQ457_05G022380 [Hibiscus cannabinus]